MPTSIMEGKDWLIPRIVRARPSSILDIGVGEGTYAKMLRPYLPKTTFIGVEIWEPYVDEYGLADLYDMILLGDARQLDYPRVEVVIMGDVLEHMPYADAVTVWQKARRAASRFVLASIPIVECPQVQYPNPHEQHVHVWNHYLAASLPGVQSYWVGQVIGTYIAPGTKDACENDEPHEQHQWFTSPDWHACPGIPMEV